MLHMVKLAVGIASIDDLAHRQRTMMEGAGDGLDGTHADGRPWLRTRMYPRRAEEILQGGSLYRVIGGMILCRQRIADIRPDVREDGAACALVVLAPAIVPVVPRPMRPFQGWRYLRPADAPPDLGAGGGDATALPEALRRDLAGLCLI
ncbi:conserved hypothetical protein [Gluconacetobacter diazotrophicus PA1 5]|uniref:Uncharacterized protein n=2 Tax=Gluconacetobacter diazotrophicus TaxID=33996 RepID=A9HMP3_GLUDA|nr:DUF1489 domain-containing protein [Gluconacetobacter diazotrophicus]ACI50424.1 conserved hypothetical protein [Gluconacetobacter diazotrophicus PA1 5]MBB2156317.1 DUF1489 domain-containing protein [Gluconacetobacter diazotrophicus]TWB08281.1 hypothetical protein FBZ86_10717 [Gluconacetobacter diazotrophicus]CAP56331.1 conserved hypothetical protein [Gluconacetobacter diazotrophicus PA1 5]